MSHDEYFLKMLSLVAARSTCGRRSVGAILVDERHQILATGYNGVVRGQPHCLDEKECWGRFDPPGDSNRCAAVHAEVNAILQCYRHDLIHTIYVSCTPCYACAKMLCNTSLKRVVVLETYADTLGAMLFETQGVIIVVAEPIKT